MRTLTAETRACFKALGVYIMQLRKEQGLTQAELALEKRHKDLADPRLAPYSNSA